MAPPSPATNRRGFVLLVTCDDCAEIATDAPQRRAMAAISPEPLWPTRIDAAVEAACVLDRRFGPPSAPGLLRSFRSKLLGFLLCHIEDIRALSRILEVDRDTRRFTLADLITTQITHKNGSPGHNRLLVVN
jgi:hypothetical protein